MIVICGLSFVSVLHALEDLMSPSRCIGWLRGRHFNTVASLLRHLFQRKEWHRHPRGLLRHPIHVHRPRSIWLVITTLHVTDKLNVAVHLSGEYRRVVVLHGSDYLYRRVAEYGCFHL